MKNRFAPSPFWAVNDILDTEETEKQLKDMLDLGFGGAFFHSRHGLITEYMSEEWFDNVKAAIKCAKENSGYLWLYDEDLFPSGNAGGKVASLSDDMRAAQIRFEFVPKNSAPIKNKGIFQCAYRLHGRRRNPAQMPLAQFVFSKPENEIEKFELISLEEAEKDILSERIVIKKFYAPKTPWWSGESYSNMLNPKVTEKFIELTHEKYKEKIGKEFGKTVPGIFTDEPHLLPDFNAVPWWDNLPEKYHKETGRNIWEDLPYMIFDHENAMEARLLISRCITDLFVQSYDRQVYEWCEKNGLIFTGHYSAEDYFDEQLKYHMGPVMAHYRYSHIPGVDHLCRQTDGLKESPNFNFNSFLTVKQASSAAHQYGREEVLAEIWGVTAHNMRLSDFIHIGNVHIGLGATFFVPHLSWYSMKGRRKRDFPPLFNYQQTYWKDFSKVIRYFDNVSSVMTGKKSFTHKGKENITHSCDILVIHTIESGIALRKLGFVPNSPSMIYDRETVSENLPYDINCEDMSRVTGLETLFRNTVKAVSNMGYECDLGDENYIQEMGAVQDNLFILGKMKYRTVIIPEAVTFRPSTIEKLYKFAKKGGQVILLGKVASLCDGKERDISMTDLLKLENVIHAPQSKAQLQAALNRIYRTDYTLTDPKGEYTENTVLTRKKTEEGEIFFICNSEKNYIKEYKLTIENKNRTLYKINPGDLSLKKAETEICGSRIIYNFRLEQSQAEMLFLSDRPVKFEKNSNI